MKLESQIEAVLFWKAEPISLRKLGDILNKNENEVKEAISALAILLQNRGLTLIQSDNEVALGTTKDASELIEKLTKEELIKDLGKAGLETLSIILYQGPISRAGIDYIRGVNSQFIMRNLLVRGLVEKIENEKNQRSFLYKASMELISYLGLSKLSDLPEYEKVKADIEEFKNTQESGVSGVNNNENKNDASGSQN